MSKIVTFAPVKEDGRYNSLVILSDGTAYRHSIKAFSRNQKLPVDLTGVRLNLEDDGSGYRGQRHVIALTLVYPDGHEEYQTVTLKGIVARQTWRELQTLATRHNSEI